MSGLPIFEKSTKLLEYINNHLKGKIGLVGVGGIENARQAYTKILVGASLVQLYTGLLYQGPNIVKIITNEIAHFLKRDGFKTISEAVGTHKYEEAIKLNSLL